MNQLVSPACSGGSQSIISPLFFIMQATVALPWRLVDLGHKTAFGMEGARRWHSKVPSDFLRYRFANVINVNVLFGDCAYGRIARTGVGRTLRSLTPLARATMAMKYRLDVIRRAVCSQNL